MTPLAGAVEAYLAKGLARFHMPGHKGRAEGLFAEISEYDITEVEGADSLYECAGALRETERQYADLYGSGDCLLSAGGSTLCVQAMLAAVLRPGEKFLIGRNCHSSAVHAAALCGFEPVWLTEQTPQALEHAFSEHSDVRTAYLTSPDYFGRLADIEACSKVCHARSAKLLVDNAHGAHLPFFEENLHPMHLSADLCADSLHKTLPVLTGGALLHLRDPSLHETAKRRMRLFGSTSPSYLIMLSADGCLDYLRTRARADFPALALRMEALGALAAENGLSPLGYAPRMERASPDKRFPQTGRALQTEQALPDERFPQTGRVPQTGQTSPDKCSPQTGRAPQTGQTSPDKRFPQTGRVPPAGRASSEARVSLGEHGSPGGPSPRMAQVDPARLTLSVSAAGLTGAEFGARLRRFGIEPEYVSPARAVLMASPFNAEEDFRRLEEFIRSTPGRGIPAEEFCPDFTPEQKMPMREALFAGSEEIPSEEAAGRTAASLEIPCPPCVALTVPGETIGAETARLLLEYGVGRVRVIR